MHVLCKPGVRQHCSEAFTDGACSPGKASEAVMNTPVMGGSNLNPARGALTVNTGRRIGSIGEARAHSNVHIALFCIFFFVSKG